jgi:hypothetical protein
MPYNLEQGRQRSTEYGVLGDPFNASVPYLPSVHDNDVLQAASPA